jgi:hypothetical protein
MNKPQWKSVGRAVVGTGSLVLVLYGVLLLYGLHRFGSIGGLLAFLQGRALYVQPSRTWFGGLAPGEPFKASVRLQNLTGGPLKVLGSHTSCSCTSAEGLPLELGPGQARDVSVQLRSPVEGPPEFQISVTFYVNVAGEQPEAWFHGRVQTARKGLVARSKGGS